MYKYIYKSPLNFDDIVLKSDGIYLTGLWFINSKNIDKNIVNYIEKDLPIFKETSKWLDIYFKGEIPDFTPKYRLENLTPFRKKVLSILIDIPYGKTLTYKDIALKFSDRMSSQAIGGAVGANPISIIIPCHRVVGSNNFLTGYSGGLNNKIELLKIGNIMIK